MGADLEKSQSQGDKFRELARELECDQDEAAFEEQVRRVARSNPNAPPGVKPDDDA